VATGSSEAWPSSKGDVGVSRGPPLPPGCGTMENMPENRSKTREGRKVVVCTCCNQSWGPTKASRYRSGAMNCPGFPIRIRIHRVAGSGSEFQIRNRIKVYNKGLSLERKESLETFKNLL